MNARTLLSSGQVAEARQTLVRAQAQSVLQPVTPDQPYAMGNSATAIRIRDAIRMLDMGNKNSAMQAINMAMTDSPGGVRVWPSYPRPPSYGYQTVPSYYTGGSDQ